MIKCPFYKKGTNNGLCLHRACKEPKKGIETG
jgi:hypothetical protein